MPPFRLHWVVCGTFHPLTRASDSLQDVKQVDGRDEDDDDDGRDQDDNVGGGGCGSEWWYHSLRDHHVVVLVVLMINVNVILWVVVLILSYGRFGDQIGYGGHGDFNNDVGPDNQWVLVIGW